VIGVREQFLLTSILEKEEDDEGEEQKVIASH